MKTASQFPSRLALAVLFLLQILTLVIFNGQAL